MSAGERTTGNILSIAAGAAAGTLLMLALGIGGGVPAVLFAVGGSYAGELIYKHFAKPANPDETARRDAEKE
jgi:hypothetical protein